MCCSEWIQNESVHKVSIRNVDRITQDAYAQLLAGLYKVV